MIALFAVTYKALRLNSNPPKGPGKREGKIPSSAEYMAVIEAKVAIPKHAQACYVWLFLENPFL